MTPLIAQRFIWRAQAFANASPMKAIVEAVGGSEGKGPPDAPRT